MRSLKSIENDIRIAVENLELILSGDSANMEEEIECYNNSIVKLRLEWMNMYDVLESYKLL